jgi:hypothetical protein
LVSENLYLAASIPLIGCRNPAAVFPLAALRPAAPAAAANGSLMPWLLAALVLAVIVVGGLYLASRR